MMRMYRCHYGMDVDLDSPDTYKHLPQQIQQVRASLLKEIGYAHCYMNYWQKELFKKNKNCGGQRARVENLIKKYAEEEAGQYENLKWYQEMLFLFHDEIENMC
mgnify:CR=1 FL=1